ncbi:EscU/YscU/HrcU family type III secretion system export apparatus switch protein [Pontibacillus sp. ALD_SL1]|uniref:EscU/YscU/HrcU family type III secretion system export apparatus switch protein n=1 Tax=Pontibacillus sp. ALD_SL1 TaxID=2777185 RepID=UPI001A9616F0|nr:EscU/YscU/HrcU family type III secretion system export apparatus switch protein [Pontibacillus sp. ALD_SL1]QST01570.1 EscU/YscU/HrcU family type III secretion system export apparatus switch protein [Pontibacillus sp. ALD_SL1]
MSESNQKREAVALSYDEEQFNAPKVVAKGKGDIAANIINKANDYRVPIQEDPTLVKLLGELDINEKIPEELYQAVAEVFAYVYQLDKQMKS